MFNEKDIILTFTEKRKWPPYFNFWILFKFFENMVLEMNYAGTYDE